MKDLLIGIVLLVTIWKVSCQCGVHIPEELRLPRQVAPCQMFPSVNYDAVKRSAPEEIARVPNPQIFLNQHDHHMPVTQNSFIQGGFGHGHGGGSFGHGSFGNHFSHGGCGRGRCGESPSKIKIKMMSRNDENNADAEEPNSYKSDNSMPAPPCPKNYLFSCQPSVSHVPCSSGKSY